LIRVLSFDKKSIEAWQKVLESENIVIISHKNPDVDAISSSLSIYHLLLLNKKKSKVVNYSNLSKDCDFLSGFDKITKVMPPKYDLVISLDAASIDRLGFKIDENSFIINIDHHQTNTEFGTINLVDPKAVSTTQVIYDFIKANNLTINRPIAQAIYSGIFKDSGYFQYERVNSKVFEVASKLNSYKIDPSFIATQLTQRDSLAKVRAKAKILDTLTLYNSGKVASIELTQDMITQTGCSSLEVKDSIKDILSISVVDIAIFFREINKNRVIISIRSKNGVNISSLSMALGGGGHKYSAGATIDMDLSSAKAFVIDKIKRSLNEV
jgi:phosphoesterase RecJ-like protein